MEAIGPAVMVAVLVVVIPVTVIVSGALAAAILGSSLKKDADERNEGTEYVALGG